MNRRCTAVIILLFCCGFINAASFFSPVPAPASAEAGIYFSRDLHRQDGLEISLALGSEIYFSLFPASSIPAVSAGPGIGTALFFDDLYEGLFLSAEANFNIFLNPFIYNNNINSIDLLAAVETELSTGWRIVFDDNIMIEPAVGGRFSLAGSLMHFSELFWYTGLYAKINLLIKF